MPVYPTSQQTKFFRLYEAVGFFLLVDLVAFSAANTVGLYAIFLVILKGEPNIKTYIYCIKDCMTAVLLVIFKVNIFAYN